MASSVSDWVKVYWSTLETQLDAIDTDLFDELAAEAVTRIAEFDTSFLSTSAITRAQALYVCVESGGFSSVGGYAAERHYDTLKLFDRTWKKQTNYDMWIGELCRLLRVTPKELLAKSATARASLYNKYKINSVFLAPDLSQRASPFRDYEMDDVRTDRKDYPLDNRYGDPDG